MSSRRLLRRPHPDVAGSRRMQSLLALTAALNAAAVTVALPARSQTATPAVGPTTPAAAPNVQKAVPAASAPTPPKTWWSTVTFGAQADAGITGNFDRPPTASTTAGCSMTRRTPCC